MPYIKNEKRWEVNNLLRDLSECIGCVGDLDYCITILCEEFLKKCGGLKFENMAKIAGTLFFVLLENYRRIAAPYEDLKKEENGDVYTNKIKEGSYEEDETR